MTQTFYYWAFLSYIFLFTTRQYSQLLYSCSNVFLAGALGFEMLSGFNYNVGVSGMYISSILVTLEELLGNLGVVVFISALLTYIKLQPNLKNTHLEFV